MNNITVNDFIEAFKDKYAYDSTDEAYFDDDDFLKEVEELIEDYEDVNEDQMAEDIYNLLYSKQYGDTSDVDDLDEIREDLYNRFPFGRLL